MFKKRKEGLQVEPFLSWIEDQLKMSADFVNKTLQLKDQEIKLMYINTVTDNEHLHNLLIVPFYTFKSIEEYKEYIASLPNNKKIEKKEQTLLEMSKGSILIHITGNLYLIDNKKNQTDSIVETSIEPTIYGLKFGFTEDLQTNINMIRHKYHQPSLIVEKFEIGQKKNHSLAIIYDKETVDENVLMKVKEKINQITNNMLITTSQFQLYFNNHHRTLMPTMMLTERTDRVIYNLAGGKIALILDGSPDVVLVPAVFYDFITSMEDGYHTYWIAIFMKILRYFGLFTCLLLPGVYVALTSYNPEILRPALALSVAGSRMTVPYSSFLEMLIMLIFLELLTEASIRLPKAVSGTATTVGGLILGTAATEAALTSNIMIIIVSAVAIATFSIPINEMSLAIRVIRYVLLLFSTISGIVGMILSFLAFILYLANLDSFGEPYLKLFIQKKKDETKGV